MTLSDQVEQFLLPQGTLAKAINDYNPRQQQQQMAQAVAIAIEENSSLIVEAGTGVGKTFAYLLPALLSGKKTLISTASKNLQDQLFNKDIPQLTKILGKPLQITLLKGRASYLCLYRLELAQSELNFGDSAGNSSIEKLKQWANVSLDGDLSNYPIKQIRQLQTGVTATHETCLGSSCPEYRECFVYRARRKAMAADVVVINHHLFFADLALQRSGGNELFPEIELLIFDEAHQLNSTGVQFLGHSLSSKKLVDLAQDILSTGVRLASGLQDWHKLSQAITQAAQNWRLCFPIGWKTSRLPWQKLTPDGVDEQAWAVALQQLQQTLQSSEEILQSMVATNAEFSKLLQRIENAHQSVKMFLQPVSAEQVRWIELAEVMQAVQLPLDINGVFNDLLTQQPATQLSEKNQKQSIKKSLIFTSATLGCEPTLDWFRTSSGINDNLAPALQIHSPFNYQKQAALYIPEQFPLPNDAHHSQAVADLVLQAASCLKGATLVLTTSLSALEQISSWLKYQQQQRQLPFEVMQQNELAKHQLLEKFRNAGCNDKPGMVLVASQSFWHGVDVAGQALKLVVLDKLPFPSPQEPLTKARCDRLKNQAKNSFKDYLLPETAVTLKQGAGRLIRHENDKGILVIADSRIRHASYGSYLLRSLPQMHQITNRQQFLASLQKLAIR